MTQPMLIAAVASVVGSGVVSFLTTHPVLMALTASAAWLYAGRDYFRKGNLVGAFLWEGIGVLILIVFCIGVLLSAREARLSVGIAFGAIIVEIWLIRKWARERP